jgi:hypothetical protein
MQKDQNLTNNFMKKNQFILLACLLSLFLLSTASFAFALENPYPVFPGLPDINNNPTIGQFTGYFFGIGIYVAGFVALISFAWGAITLMTSAENPTARSDAQDRMKNAIIGLILTFASFIIIRTINPALVSIAPTYLNSTAGIFYFNSSFSPPEKPAPSENSDTSTIPQGYGSLEYKCPPNGGPALLLWKFPNKNLENGTRNFDGVQVVRLECGAVEPLNGVGSFKTAFDTVGVYYCLGGCSGNMCSGYMSSVNISDHDPIPEPFKSGLKGVRIVNNFQDHYGVIFHDVPGLDNGGICYDPKINEGNETTCMPLNNMSFSAANIFSLNFQNPAASGNGVEFYSEPFGQEAGTLSRGEGFYKVAKENIKTPFYFKKTSDMSFWPDNYSLKTLDEYKKNYKTFSDRAGSVYVKGNYLVALFSNANGGWYCQTFNKTVPNLNAQQIITTASKDEKISEVYIIPVK